jgi:hypothetical protein
VQQIQYEVYISVGQIPSLEGENHRFWFWLVKSELEPGLIFGTRSRTRTGVSDFTKKQNQTGTGSEIFGGKEMKKRTRTRTGSRTFEKVEMKKKDQNWGLTSS